MTSLEATIAYPERLTTKAMWVLCPAVLALATACGGGGESTPAVNGNPPVVATSPAATAYSVVVKTVDTQGQPIAGVSVALNGSFNGMSASTGSDGATTFNFNAGRTADASLTTHFTGYHAARRKFQLDGAASPVALQQLTLTRTDEAQLVLTSVTAEVSADASSVVVSADIGVSGLNGSPVAGLSAADFSVPSLDCLGFGFPCIWEPSGAPLSNGDWVPSRANPVQVTLPGAGLSTPYKVRYVLEAVPGMFTAGRTVLTHVQVRVGTDTSLTMQVNVRL